jgi:type III secretion protein C
MKKQNRSHARRGAMQTLAALGLAAWVGAWAPAHAAPIPWGGGEMPTISARDMPLQDFVQALVGDQGWAVVVSAAASSKLVNGRFSGSAARVFDSVARSSALLPYFDGGTLYIFTSAEVQRRTINMTQGSAERVISTLNQLRLHDGRYNTFTAVPASGLLQVAGAKPFVDQVQEVVRSVQLSASASPEQIGVFALKHAWAWDVSLNAAGKQVVVPGVATLLRTLLGKAGVVGVSRNTRASVPKLRGRGLAAGVESDALNDPSTLPNYSDESEEQRIASGASTAGGPTVTAEIRTNSVVVRDTPDRLPQYAELIKALDVEPVMVELEATIVDVNSDKLLELGVQWRGAGTTGRNEVRLGRGDASDLALRGPTASDVTPVGRGLNWSTVLESGRLIARISALAADGNARVISRAQVATMSNLESSIQSNETAYVRVNGFQEVDLFPVSATTNVRITPRVFLRGTKQIVSMVVNIRDGKFSAAVVDQIPLVKEVSVSTNGMVPDGQTFVIGGFRQEVNSKTADKVPLLGNIPVLGGLFRTTKDQVTNAERLFLLTPRVVSVAELIDRPSVDPATLPQSRAKEVTPPAPVTVSRNSAAYEECVRQWGDPGSCSHL